MRGKRSKQYRKLMERYSMTFGFREPYQVLVDATMIQDSCRFKMDLEPALERTAHGKVKPMVTQCEIRKLYARKNEPGVSEAIELAKTFERRRCGHHPDEYPEPLSTQECLRSVVDPKETGENKHRYVVASQDDSLRRMLRSVRGVPQIYIKRSVMILEPMADESVEVRAREERSKFRAEIKKKLGKRKREDKDGQDGENDGDESGEAGPRPGKDGASGTPVAKKKKRPGVKGPNPLSVKKAKKKPTTSTSQESEKPKRAGKAAEPTAPPSEEAAKRKRRRKNQASEAAPGEGDRDNGAPLASTGDDG